MIYSCGGELGDIVVSPKFMKCLSPAATAGFVARVVRLMLRPTGWCNTGWHNTGQLSVGKC